MAAKKKSHAAPRKQFAIPANLIPLQGYATIIINAMRGEYYNRINNGGK